MRSPGASTWASLLSARHPQVTVLPFREDRLVVCARRTIVFPRSRRFALRNSMGQASWRTTRIATRKAIDQLLRTGISTSTTPASTQHRNHQACGGDRQGHFDRAPGLRAARVGTRHPRSLCTRRPSPKSRPHVPPAARRDHRGAHARSAPCGKLKATSSKLQASNSQPEAASGF